MLLILSVISVKSKGLAIKPFAPKFPAISGPSTLAFGCTADNFNQLVTRNYGHPEVQQQEVWFMQN